MLDMNFKKMESIQNPETIKSIRKQLGLTQEKLARRLDVTTTTVARWELGMCGPNGRNMLKLLSLDHTKRKK